ncbi:WS/DGAT/MGAT family acyltransferase [Nocardia tenerifensis]|uniref:Diacylglycerol O-acyltransferase n=2 Tax=Nocardia tenerifensis TaxID=228006 RepID=A0A318KKM8_9NOCA|nr:WS/DGAT/MGAT family acyltransferase [Nocardia tenerifensis]
MHVATLQLFEAPAEAGSDFARQIYEKLRADPRVDPTFRKHPTGLIAGAALGWTCDNTVDLDYHLRLSALPHPGGMARLLELVARLHSGLLDRHRPLWEAHLIEGLGPGRFAFYTKWHHALIDGASAQRLFKRSLTMSPEPDQCWVAWHVPPRTPHPNGRVRESTATDLRRALRTTAEHGTAAARVARATLLRKELTLPFEAPRTIFNVPIGGARRIAVRSWPRERISAVAKAAAATSNDVLLAMSAGALRTYLATRNALPDKPLIAMVPTTLRSDDEQGLGGNKVGAILCSLATDVADPAKRLLAIRDSMRHSRSLYNSLPTTQALALSAAMLSPIVTGFLPGLARMAVPPFNIVISNVPGLSEQMYWCGATLNALYPLSIPLDGQAVNITLTRTADNIDFGLVACRRAIPDLTRLLDDLERALADMEAAVRHGDSSPYVLHSVQLDESRS